ncbi:MAG: protein kinase [Pseudomonadota bacterium]
MNISVTRPINTKYKIIKPLGKGGMGEVFLAHDLSLDRKVAIKYLQSATLASESAYDLKSEAKHLAKLNSKHIVQVYELTRIEGQTALVLEYVNGKNLHFYLREHSPSLAQMLLWLSQISEGLACAHAAGITHRDLKAENVLICKDGVAKITDFGIAQSLANYKADILALGELAQRMLDAVTHTLPAAVVKLLQELTYRSPSKRLCASESARRFHHAWLESTQVATQSQKHQRPRNWGLRNAAIFCLTASIFAGLIYWYSASDEQEQTFIAVIPTTLSTHDGAITKEQENLRRNVEKALRERTIESTALSLVSLNDDDIENDEFYEVAESIRADEAVLSSLKCDQSSVCRLRLVRINVAENTIIGERVVNLMASMSLEAYQVVRNQFSFLYPQLRDAQNGPDLISDADYEKYMAIFERSRFTPEDDPRTLTEIEDIMDRARHFSPLYSLYANVAIDLYYHTDDTKYLDKVDSLLSSIEIWGAGSLFFHESMVALSLERGDFHLARNEVKQLEALGADSAKVNMLQGDIFSFMSNYADAERHFRIAYELESSTELLRRLADNYYYWGKLDLAVSTTMQALAEDPQDVRSLISLGWIKIEEANTEEAIDALQRAHQILPNIWTKVPLGISHMLAGDHFLARRLFNEALEMAPSRADILLNLGGNELLSGNKEAADECYRRVVALHTGDNFRKEPWVAAMAYANLGDFENAIALVTDTPKQGPQSDYAAALVYALAGQNYSALVEIERALASRVSPSWFSLPMFDGLCIEPKFEEKLSNAGLPDRCESVVHIM